MSNNGGAGLLAGINNNASKLSGLAGPGIIPQILISATTVVLIYVILASVEMIYGYINRMSLYRVELLPDTYTTDTKSITIMQNPNDPTAKTVALSDNERSGPEYSYSFFLYVNPSTFRQEQGLQHIFHKGVPGQFPLLNPGVYMRSDTNCLRVYMNTFKTWNTYVEVENFPVGKWVYVTIVCKGSHGEVYVNGNLAKKLLFEGYQAYQNYGNIYCFSQRRITLPKTIPSVGEAGFDVFGSVKGLVSRLTYFSYALSYSEISSLMAQGPSSKMDTKDMVVPPYLDDTWWTQKY
jgi:hypothetical protein